MDIVVDALEEMKAQNIVKINVQQLSNVTDLILIATGTSNRHIRSLADNVVKRCKEQGISLLGIEGQDNSDWVLVDLGDIVVHIMSSASREFYDLEGMWKVMADTEIAS